MSIKRHHSGVVGRVLGKEMGKGFFFAFAPVSVKDVPRRLHGDGRKPPSLTAVNARTFPAA
jgi:hypothetical protein